MKNLSKSRYTLFRQCPKALWLRIYKPEVATEDKALEARFAEGNIVGDLAMGYLGPFEEVTSHTPDGGLDLSEMCRRTRDCMTRGMGELTPSTLLDRRVYRKFSGDKVMLHKFLIWKTNKESTGRYPAYIFYHTDYSSGRKDILKRDMAYAPDETGIRRIFEAEILDNVKKGWEAVA